MAESIVVSTFATINGIDCGKLISPLEPSNYGAGIYIGVSEFEVEVFLNPCLPVEINKDYNLVLRREVRGMLAGTKIEAFDCRCLGFRISPTATDDQIVDFRFGVQGEADSERLMKLARFPEVVQDVYYP